MTFMYYRKHEDNRRNKKLYDGPGHAYRVGVYFNEKEGRYKRYYLGSKFWKRHCNKKLRQIAKNVDCSLSKGNDYRKLTEYWWVIF